MCHLTLESSLENIYYHEKKISDKWYSHTNRKKKKLLTIAEVNFKQNETYLVKWDKQHNKTTKFPTNENKFKKNTTIEKGHHKSELFKEEQKRTRCCFE